jgi:antitoxin component of RelBE/YafQ-DinJ toxin-antitoxin module
MFQRGLGKMGLKQYAKKSKKEATTVITARLRNSRYEWFKKHCEELGLSINEAINLLVDMEYQEENVSEIEEQEEVDENQITIDEIIEDKNTIVNTKVNNDDKQKVNTKVNTRVNNKSSVKRFTTKHYEIDKELPCPICVTWQNATNFDRHAKKHATTRKEIYTDEKHLEKIKIMYDDRKGE